MADKDVVIHIKASNETQAGIDAVRKALQGLVQDLQGLNPTVQAAMQALQQGGTQGAAAVQQIIDAIGTATVVTRYWGKATTDALGGMSGQLGGLQTLVSQFSEAFDIAAVKNQVAMEKLTETVAGLKPSLAGAKQEADSFGKAFAGLKKLAGQAGLTLSVVELGRALIDTREQAEKAQVSMESLMHSAEAARAAIRDSLSFGEQGGFGSADILKADEAIARFGQSVQQVLPTVAALSAATGQELTHTAQTVGEAMIGYQRSMQLLERQFGITADRLKAYGAHLDATGHVSLKTAEDTAAFRDALEKLVATEYGDAVSKQANTMGGAITGAKDAIFDLLNTIGAQLEPTVVAAANGIRDLANWFRDVHAAQLLVIPALINEATEQQRLNTITEDSIHSLDRAVQAWHQMRDVLNEVAAAQGKVFTQTSSVPDQIGHILETLGNAKPADLYSILQKDLGVQSPEQLRQLATQTGQAYAANSTEFGALQALMNTRRNGDRDANLQFDDVSAQNRQVLQQMFPGIDKLQMGAVADRMSTLNTEMAKQSERAVSLNKAAQMIDGWSTSLGNAAEKAKQATDSLKVLRQLTGKSEVQPEIDMEKATVESLRASISPSLKTDPESIRKYLDAHGTEENNPLVQNVKLYSQHVEQLRNLQQQDVKNHVDALRQKMEDEDAYGKLTLQRRSMYYDQMAALAKNQPDILRGIHREQAQNDRAITREQANNARQDVEDQVRTFQESITGQKGTAKVDLDEGKVSQGQYASRIRDLAVAVRAWIAKMQKTLESTSYGKGLEKTLLNEAGSLDVTAAQADKTAGRERDTDLGKRVREQVEQSKILHHNQYEAQLQDLERIRTFVQSSQASEEAKTRELRSLDNDRARVQEEADRKHEQSVQKLAGLETKAANLHIKHLEKDVETGKATQEQLAQAFKDRLQFELAGIEARRQAALKAGEDEATANLEAAVATQDAYQQASDQIDALQKQMSKATASQGMTGPMNFQQAIDYLGQDTSSRWYSKDSGLTPFSLSIGPAAQADDNSPLGQVKKTFDQAAGSFQTSTNTFGGAVQQFAAAVAGSLAPGGVPPAPGAPGAPAGPAGSGGAAWANPAGSYTRQQANQANAINPRIDPSTMGGGGRFQVDPTTGKLVDAGGGGPQYDYSRARVGVGAAHINHTQTINVNVTAPPGGDPNEIASRAAGAVATATMQNNPLSQNTVPQMDMSMGNWGKANQSTYSGF